MFAARQRDKSTPKGLFFCALMVLSLIAPARADNRDETLRFSMIGNQITASYLYKDRAIFEQLAQHYCHKRFAMKARLNKPAACTKMLPMEINRCAIKSVCE